MAAPLSVKGEKIIPTIWQERILKRDFDIVLGKMLQPEQRNTFDSEEFYLRSANIQWSGVDVSDIKTMWFSEQEKKILLLRNGDLVVNEGGDVGRCAIWQGQVKECYYQNSVNRVRNKEKASTLFLYYWINNLKVAGFIDSIVAKTTIAHLTAEKLEAMPWPSIPLAEQIRIADYLDASCAAIDAAVNAKKKQLESLEHLREEIIENAVTKGIHIPVDMQMIGDEWIGEIPANWTVVRLKRIISAVDYGISESTIQEGRFLVLKMGHIQGGEIKVTKNDYVDDVSGNLLLDNGDLLFNRTNSPDQVGKAAIFRGEKSDEITFASYLVRLKTNHRADSYYFNYVLNSRGFLSFARKLAIPSVQQSNLNATRYCRMLVPLPPIEEQRLIRKFLDAKISEVSALFSNIESQIATLIDYRKSLIHECVTGQRRISEADVAKVERTLEQAARLPQQ